MVISCLLCPKTEGNNYMIYLDEFISPDRVTSCELIVSCLFGKGKANIPKYEYETWPEYIWTNNLVGKIIKKSIKTLYDLAESDRYIFEPGQLNMKEILLRFGSIIQIELIIRHRPYKISKSEYIKVEGNTMKEKFDYVMEYARLNSRCERIVFNTDLSIKFIRSHGTDFETNNRFSNLFIDWQPDYIETRDSMVYNNLDPDEAHCVEIKIGSLVKQGVLCDAHNTLTMISDDYPLVNVNGDLTFVYGLTEFSSNGEWYLDKPYFRYDTSSHTVNMEHIVHYLDYQYSLMQFIADIYNGYYILDDGVTIDTIMSDIITDKKPYASKEDVMALSSKYNVIRNWIKNNGEK